MTKNFFDYTENDFENFKKINNFLYKKQINSDNSSKISTEMKEEYGSKFNEYFDSLSKSLVILDLKETNFKFMLLDIGLCVVDAIFLGYSMFIFLNGSYFSILSIIMTFIAFVGLIPDLKECDYLYQMAKRIENELEVRR